MDRYFNIHGITVRLSADHQTLLEQTSQELRFFESEPLPSTQISVSVIEQDDLNGYKTNWAAFHEEVESETHWINQSIASIMNIPKRTVQLYLVPSTPVDAAVVILFGVIGFYVQLELSLQKEIAAFHGASLVKEGKGILLLGKTNSGKTSLSYRMSDLGVSYVSEEDSFIQSHKDGHFSILPYPRRIRITEEVMKQHSDLRKMPYEKELVDSLDEKVFRIDPRNPFPDHVPLKKIVFLDNDISNLEVSIDSIQKNEAFSTLIVSLEKASIHDSPETAWEELKTNNRKSFFVAKSIVDRFVISRVKYNIIRDFSILPQIILDLFESE